MKPESLKLSEHVFVYLTDKGRDIFKQHTGEFPQETPTGASYYHLFELFEVFGKHIEMNADIFKDAQIHFVTDGSAGEQNRYKLVTAAEGGCKQAFVEEISRLTGQGWRPAGGPFICAQELQQAMYLPTVEEPKSTTVNEVPLPPIFTAKEAIRIADTVIQSQTEQFVARCLDIFKQCAAEGKHSARVPGCSTIEHEAMVAAIQTLTSEPYNFTFIGKTMFGLHFSFSPLKHVKPKDDTDEGSSTR